MHLELKRASLQHQVTKKTFSRNNAERICKSGLDGAPSGTPTRGWIFFGVGGRIHSRTVNVPLHAALLGFAFVFASVISNGIERLFQIRLVRFAHGPRVRRGWGGGGSAKNGVSPASNCNLGGGFSTRGYDVALTS
jgi:hypothetical protein